MRKFWIFTLIITILLTGCQKAEKPISVDSLNKQAALFEMTPTAAGEKGAEELAQSHVVVTAASLSGYPTPLPTYLVPVRVVTLTPGISTSAPTATPTSIQQTAVAPTSTPAVVVPTKTATPDYIYALQAGAPVYIANFVNAAVGCNWQGIAGQAFSAAGTPVWNLVVKAGGTWNGTTSALLGMGMTGAAPAYGEGGYEITLGTTAVNSTGTVWIQVYDLTGKALTDKVYINTYADCTKNLTIVNFNEKTAGYNIYLPMVMQTFTP